MSRARHTEAEIIAVLKQVEAGRKAEDVPREALDQSLSCIALRFMFICIHLFGYRSKRRMAWISPNSDLSVLENF
jgi:hypothetical protein